MEKQRGLTLLEMLVSILILTTVLALTSTSYSYYVGQLNRQQNAFGALAGNDSDDDDSDDDGDEDDD